MNMANSLNEIKESLGEIPERNFTSGSFYIVRENSQESVVQPYIPM